MADIWDYTPRQALAFLDLSEARRGREAAALLALHANAAQGSADAINALIKQLRDG